MINDEETTPEIPATPATQTPETPETEVPDVLLRKGALEIVDLASRLGNEAWITARDASGLIREAYPDHGRKQIIGLYGQAAAVGQALAACITWDFVAYEVDMLFLAADKLASLARSLDALSPFTSAAFLAQRQRLVALAGAAVDWQLQSPKFRKQLTAAGTEEEPS
jgi:hypothetical protein